MLRKFLAWCILSAGAVAFGQSEQTEKIKKYMSLGVYEEAAAAIETAVKENEFDRYLRSAFGEISVHQQRCKDALKQFELWSRLDTGSWQALQRIAVTAEMIKTTSIMNLRDDDPAKFAAWLKAYNSWKALAKFAEKNPDPQNSELLTAQTSARETIKSYETPTGIWQSTKSDGTHNYFVVTEKTPGQFTFHMKDSPKIDLSSPLPKSEYVELKERGRVIRAISLLRMLVLPSSVTRQARSLKPAFVTLSTQPLFCRDTRS